MEGTKVVLGEVFLRQVYRGVLVLFGSFPASLLFDRVSAVPRTEVFPRQVYRGVLVLFGSFQASLFFDRVSAVPRTTTIGGARRRK